eukprot:scaffold8717_cov260-Chaetoceros_neogracile.AAC.8
MKYHFLSCPTKTAYVRSVKMERARTHFLSSTVRPTSDYLVKDNEVANLAQAPGNDIKVILSPLHCWKRNARIDVFFDLFHHVALLDEDSFRTYAFCSTGKPLLHVVIGD